MPTTSAAVAPASPRPETFRLARLALRLSQREVARRARVSGFRLWSFEAGYLDDLRADEWTRIKRVVDIPRLADLAALLAVSGEATEREAGP
jgi:hypothetical protein